MKKLLLIIFLLIALSIFINYLFIQKSSTATPQPVVTEYKGLWILVDTSMSMRGYFNPVPRAGTVIQRFLWNGLITVLKETYLDDTVYISPFADDIKESEPVKSLLKTFRFDNISMLENFFSGIETKLLEVLRRIANSNYKVFIVVTDSLPSERDTAGPSPQMIEAVRHLINQKKNNLWLIGLKSEFTGRIYPECPDKTGNRIPFDFAGRRPIFVWLGSKDKEKGIEIVTKILERFRGLLSPQDLDQVKVAELSFLDLPTARISFEKISGVTTIPPRNPDDPLEMRVLRSSESFDVPIHIEWIKERIEKEEEIEINITPENLRGVSVFSQNNRWYLHLETRSIPRRILTLRLMIRPVVERWWAQWSTKDDSIRENAHQILYLEPLVSEFMNPHLDKSCEIAFIKVAIR